MKVINQEYKVEIDGVLVTQRVSTARASKTLNRLYDVLRMNLSYKVAKKATVVATIGDYVFNGFVYSSSKIGHSNYSIECKSNNALLASPFYQDDEVTYDDAQTSLELFGLYSVMGGINIVSTEINLYFGVSYKREGTPLQEIEKVCNVTKADFYDSGTGIIIEPKKDTSELGRVLSVSEYENFLQTKTDIENSGIRWVVINENLSKPKKPYDHDKGIISYEIQKNNEIIITANEFDTLKGSRFLTPNFKSWNFFPIKDELISVNDEEVVLPSSIKRIDRLLVNGISVGYTHKFGSSLIEFTTKQRGTVSIRYVANAFKTSLTTTPVFDSKARAWKFDALVGGEWNEYQGIIKPGNGDGLIDPETGDNIYYRMTGNNYEKGFKIYASSDVGAKFSLDGVPLNLSFTKTASSLTLTEKKYIEDGNIAEIPSTATIVGIKANGVVIPYTIVTIGGKQYAQLNEAYRGVVDMTFTTTGFEYNVKDHKYDGQVVMTFKDGTETYLYTSNPDDPNDVPPEFPATVPIDVSSKMGLPVSAVSGKPLIVSNNNHSVWSGRVDKYGFIYPVIPGPGDYKINIDTIVSNAKMKLLAGCD